MLDPPIVFCHISLHLLGRLSTAKCSVPSSSQKYLFLFCQFSYFVSCHISFVSAQSANDCTSRASQETLIPHQSASQ